MDPKLLGPIEHRSEESQAHLGVIRTRDAVVRTRTALVSHVRGAVKSFGGRIPKCSTASFPAKAQDHLPDPLRPALEPTLATITELTRRLDDSGDFESELRITKTGDKLLQRLLIQAGHYILGPFGPDTDLRRWGLEYVRRGGGSRKAKKKATVAVARRLAVLLHSLWVTGEVYEPLRHTKQTVTAA